MPGGRWLASSSRRGRLAERAFTPLDRGTQTMDLNKRLTTMKEFLGTVLATVLLVALAGCSQGLSEPEMASLLNDHLAREGSGVYMAVVNLRKVNAHASADTKYTVDLEYDLLFSKGLDEIEDILSNTSADSPVAGMNAGMKIFFLKSQFGDFPAGFSVPTKNTVTFVKGEKGWMVEKAGP